MRYKDYEGFTKTYIIVHNIGFGTPEDNYEEVAPVAEADTYAEAAKIANNLKGENNPPEDLQSSWCYNTYHININTLTDDGKELLEEFYKESDALLKKAIDNPDNYTVSKSGEYTFYMQKCPEFDSPKYLVKDTKLFGSFDSNNGEYIIGLPSIT